MAFENKASEPRFNRYDAVRIAIIALLLIAAVSISIFKLFAPELSSQGHLVLSAMLIAVGLWSFGTKWIPISVGGMILMAILVSGGISMPVVFNGFTSRALWILIPALFFGFALRSTGLGNRLAYWIIGMFNPSYLTLTISFVIIGVVLSILTPSITVRITIIIPIVIALNDILKLRYGSVGAGYLMLIAWFMVLVPGSGWMTGSLWGPLGIGFFGSVPALENMIDFNSWLKVILLPTIILTIVFVLISYKIIKPSEPLKIDRETIKREFRSMKPASFHEKATLAILLLTFAFLMTSSLHGIPDVAICLTSFALLTICGVIRVKDIGTGINWNLVIFLGVAMGLSTIFQSTGVAQYLSNLFMPVINKLAMNPWLFLFVSMIFLFGWRFVDVTQLYATMPIVLALMPILYESFGYDPLVIYCLCIMVGNCFFVSYQQPFVITAESIAGNASWTARQLRNAGLIYMISCLITLAVSIPYWSAIGLI